MPNVCKTIRDLKLKCSLFAFQTPYAFISSNIYAVGSNFEVKAGRHAGRHKRLQLLPQIIEHSNSKLECSNVCVRMCG